MPAALAPVEAITGEVYPLLHDLPKPVREHLQLPSGGSWWRTVFHLAWHFPRPFLNAPRQRLLAKDGVFAGAMNETFVQLHGMGGCTDLLPGLIYSALEHDLCTCSEGAISVILDALEQHAQAEVPAGQRAPALSAEQRRTFDSLRAEFEAAAQMPLRLECRLLKLADSFDSPPASEWAGLEVGGCIERFLSLSKRNDQEEIVQIRGPATEWFCQVAEKGGNALPLWIPEHPILFDDPQRGVGGPHPVMNRNACGRWIGFVLATIKQHAPESLHVTWGTEMGPLSYGLATLDRDWFAASVLAIDLSRLTTAAAEASKREQETCSPFTAPSMEEQGFQWAEEVPPPRPPDNYTLGQLVEELRRFGQDYHRTLDRIREENPITARHSRIQLGAHVSGARACLQAIPGFTELRNWVRSNWADELCFATCRRLVDTLVERSRGRLSARVAKSLSLAEAVVQLSAAPGKILVDRLQPQRRTLKWLISTLKWYEELRAADASYRHPSGGIIGVAAGSAEAAARENNYRDLMRVSGAIAKAAGIARIQLLCEKFDSKNGMTEANVVSLRVNVCHAKPCTRDEANELSLDEVVDALEEKDAPSRHSDVDAEVGPMLELLRVFTNGIANDRLKAAGQVISDQNLTADEKLFKIDGLLPIPPTASAEQLGNMLGVSKQAIMKGKWWARNRKGEKDSEIGRRRRGHQKRAKDFEPPASASEDDE